MPTDLPEPSNPDTASESEADTLKLASEQAQTEEISISDGELPEFFRPREQEEAAATGTEEAASSESTSSDDGDDDETTDASDTSEDETRAFTRSPIADMMPPEPTEPAESDDTPEGESS